jgi:hypothetical protein
MDLVLDGPIDEPIFVEDAKVPIAVDDSILTDDYADMLSHDSRVFVDLRDDGVWQMSDIVTLEQHDMPGVGPWELECNIESGRSVAFDSAEVENDIIVDELMDRNVFVSRAGVLSLVERRGDADNVQLLSVVQTRFKEATYTVRVGHTSATISMSCFVFARRKTCGVRVFFSLPDLYVALKLETYKKQSSKWIYNCASTWEERLKMHLGVGHVIHSTACDKLDLPFESRCLPAPALSAAGTMLCLATWASSLPRHGGLTGDRPRAAALEVLRAIVRAFAPDIANRALTLHFDSNWGCRWPRPDTGMGGNKVTLVIDSHGHVDLAPWLAVIAGTTSFFAKHLFFDCGMTAFGIGSNPSLVDLLIGACNSNSPSFACQLALRMAQHLDDQLLLLSLGKLASADSAVEWISGEIAFCHRHDIDRLCSQYVESTKVCRTRWQFLTGPSDKGEAGSLNLMHTVFVFPDNQAFMAIPQVAPYYKGTRFFLYM